MDYLLFIITNLKVICTIEMKHFIKFFTLVLVGNIIQQQVQIDGIYTNIMRGSKALYIECG